MKLIIILYVCIALFFIFHNLLTYKHIKEPFYDYLNIPIGNTYCHRKKINNNFINKKNNTGIDIDDLYNYENPILTNFNLSNDNNFKFSKDTLEIIDIFHIIKQICHKKTNNKYVKFENTNNSIYNYHYTKFDATRLLKSIQYIEKKLIHLYKIQIKNNLKKYYCASLKICYPYVISRKLIKIEKSINSNDLRYTFLIEIIINNRSSSQIFKIILESLGTKNLINSIKIIGSRNSDELLKTKPYDKSDKYVNIYTKFNDSKYNAHKDYLRSSDETKIIFNNQLNNKILKKKISDTLTNYTCYGSKNASNINDCEIDINRYGLTTYKGKWDRLCISNSQCPYYKKNKNYPNTRGGCINGWCEMPLGTKQLSPHHINPDSYPLCYNCKNENNKECCLKQKNPDYAFKNDINERTDYIEILNKKGLKLY